MCTIADLKRELSKRLNDAEAGFENVRWCDELLGYYLQTAIATAADLNKASFTTRKTIELEEGCYHCVCDDCDEVVAVISAGGDNCTTPDSTDEVYSGLGQYFGHLCVTSSDDEAEDETEDPGSITIDENAPCCFRTENSVEAGVEAQVLCYKAPDVTLYTETEQLPASICSRHRIQIINLAMAEARMLDSESELALAAVARHMELAGVSNLLKDR